MDGITNHLIAAGPYSSKASSAKKENKTKNLLNGLNDSEKSTLIFELRRGYRGGKKNITEIEPIFLELFKDGNPDMRKEVIEASVEVKTRKIILCVIKALKDSDSQVRLEAAKTLKEVKTTAAENSLLYVFINDIDDKVSDKAGEALKDIITTNTLLRLIKISKGSDIFKRKRAVKMLGYIGNETAVSSLIDSLHSKDKELREAALWALSGMKDYKAKDAIIEIFEDKKNSSEIRFAAVLASGRKGNFWAVPGLIKVLEKDNDPHLRKYAAFSLGSIKSDRAIPSLIKASIYDKDSEVRKYAREAILPSTGF